MDKDLPEKADVIIIGGGIIGASIAFHLGRIGINDVMLFEKGQPGEGSTGKCAGGIRVQFSTEINILFSIYSKKIFDSFRENLGVDPEFQKIGYLFLASKSSQWEILKANAVLLESGGCEIELLTPEDIRRRWPFINTADIIGGSFTPNDGYAGPYEVLRGYTGAAKKNGVIIAEDSEVTGIESSGGRVTGVVLADGKKFYAPVVVNAAGPYAARVAGMLGLELPVMPLRRQLFFTDAFDSLPLEFPLLIDMECGWYVRREGAGLLLAGPQDEKSSFNEKMDFESRFWTAERSLHRVPVLEKAKIMTGWAGLYEISPDHHAIIGEFPEMKGFICANGFSGHGFMHSPAAGLAVTELIVNGKSETLDIKPLRPTRFREDCLINEPLTAFK
jgi:sarcosine oxidase subunit beta